MQFYLGLVRLKAGEPETGAAAFPAGAGAEPRPDGDPEHLQLHGGGAAKTPGRFDEALDCLRQGAALDPERTDIHNLMGFCHFKRGEHEQAVAAFQRVIDLDPSLGHRLRQPRRQLPGAGGDAKGHRLLSDGVEPGSGHRVRPRHACRQLEPLNGLHRLDAPETRHARKVLLQPAEASRDLSGSGASISASTRGGAAPCRPARLLRRSASVAEIGRIRLQLLGRPPGRGAGRRSRSSGTGI
ncbi:MAG: tetratricopeptide repeat protein [Desulfobacterales bacterium]|nr:tetratricopeptide repeat protein [Desulfobacterales bacterium]